MELSVSLASSYHAICATDLSTKIGSVIRLFEKEQGQLTRGPHRIGDAFTAFGNRNQRALRLALQLFLAWSLERTFPSPKDEFVSLKPNDTIDSAKVILCAHYLIERLSRRG